MEYSHVNVWRRLKQNICSKNFSIFFFSRTKQDTTQLVSQNKIKESVLDNTKTSPNIQVVQTYHIPISVLLDPLKEALIEERFSSEEENKEFLCN